MAAAPHHIRCSTSCQSEGGKLVLSKCGRCIFHTACLPAHCKCGRAAAPSKPIGREGCYVKNCTKSPEGWHILCDPHAAEVVGQTVKRLKLVGSLQHAALLSYLQYYPGMQLEGDLLQLVSEQVTRALRDGWQIFCTQDGRYVYFLEFIARLAETTPFCPDAMAKNLDLPPEAAVERRRNARSGIDGWDLLADGKVRHCAKNTVHTPTNRKELADFLSCPSRPTFPTALAAAFYPSAPGDISALISEGKLIYLEHYKFVASPPPHYVPNAGLRDYWMTHVAPGLRSAPGGAGP